MTQATQLVKPFLTQDTREELSSNLPDGLHPLVPHKFDTSRNAWTPCAAEDPVSYEFEACALPQANLGQYLLGEALGWVKLGDYVWTEPHVGIERSTETLRPETGMIYSVEFHRLAYRKPAAGGWQAESAVYAVEVLAPEDSLPEDTVFTAGGERRPFRIRRARGPEWFPDGLRTEIAEHLIRRCWDQGVCRFRLYLLTPALSRAPEGWRPDFLSQPDTDFEFTLVAAAVPRAIPYSGWDMMRRQPREGYRLAPAGSVYFLEARPKQDLEQDESVRRLMDRFWLGSTLADENDGYRRMGFGLTLIGGWSYAG